MGRKALWSGRFERGMDDSVLAFSSSLDNDSRLAFYDVMGSLAHVRMLGATGVLPADDVQLISGALKTILRDIEDGRLELDASLEDVHTNIEQRLTEIVGPSGGMLHTARSRNDQIATDFRMYLRDAVLSMVSSVSLLQRTLIKRAEAEADSVMPGYTHMQHAQPVSLGFHLMAHAFRLDRDAERLMDAFRRINVCPLGSAAMAGTTYPIDRRQTADLLAFSAPSDNAMDSVSDRDFVLDAVYCATTIALHLSSLCEELVIWSSPEFGFVEMDESYSTGSSIMPQKKNPDVAELVRGRSGRAAGALSSLLIALKGLPMAYNRDLQEDKAPAMWALDSVLSSLDMTERMMATLSFDTARMREMSDEGFINATDLADYLVMKGMPFRQAHEVVATAVRECISAGLRLEDLGLERLRSYSDMIEEDVLDMISVEECVKRRRSYGGTAPQCVTVQATECLDRVMRRESAVDEAKRLIDAAWEKLLG